MKRRRWHDVESWALVRALGRVPQPGQDDMFDLGIALLILAIVGLGMLL